MADDLNPPSPPPPSSGGRREAKAELKAAKARDKAMRPWWKKKRFVIPLVLVVLMAVGSAIGAGSEDEADTTLAADTDETTTTESAEEEEEEEEEPAEDETTTTAAPESSGLYPDRPDRQKDDKEASIGEGVQLSGYTATLNGATIRPEDFVTDSGHLVSIDVKIENRDDRAQPYSTFDWRIQTANGQVLDPTFVDDTLGSGDLVPGGTVEGKVSFDAGPGTYYIIYKPDPFDADRGIWQITV